jgi:LDH2 family malate/lactate/ureidoglycolate dehydrogenase
MMRRFQADLLRRQIEAVLAAWGLPVERQELMSGLMIEADLRGIDSHGIGMLPHYEVRRLEGKVFPDAEPVIETDMPAFCIVDAGHGLGHASGALAMQKAIEKAKTVGVGMGLVKHSNHYGAAGVYATMAADQGMIGMSMTGTSQRSIVPTFAKEPMYSTNPIACAVPAGCRPPFVLDMATSTVAVGKLDIYRRQGKPLPEGWALTPEGDVRTDAQEAFDARPRRMTPLGGDRERGSHKGYGLAIMVDILSSVLTGSWFGAHDLKTGKTGKHHMIGSFFLALDPDFFRDERSDFDADMDSLIDTLKAVPAVDPDKPVMVAGEPERIAKAERKKDGIPVSDTLIEELRKASETSGAAFLLGN